MNNVLGPKKIVLNTFAYCPYNIERCNSFSTNEFQFKVEVHVTNEECDLCKVQKYKNRVLFKTLT